MNQAHRMISLGGDRRMITQVTDLLKTIRDRDHQTMMNEDLQTMASGDHQTTIQDAETVAVPGSRTGLPIRNRYQDRAGVVRSSSPIRSSA